MDIDTHDIGIQIPVQAWISSIAIRDIDKTLDNEPEIHLQTYISRQKGITNIWGELNPDNIIYNDGFLLMMAYAFLVVPKEVIQKNGWIISSSEIDKAIKKIQISSNVKVIGLSRYENIIRHIRNSISHADFKLQDDELAFNDHNHQGEITFEGTIHIDDFKYLLQEYFKVYVKNCFDHLK